MHSAHFLRVLSLLLLTLGLSLSTRADTLPNIGELSPTDLRYMADQRASIDDLTRRHFGRLINGNKDSDLALLQRLLDDGLVRPEQTRELQAMGIIMGDLLAADLDMHWVVYEDKVGRSRALRYRQTEEYLFPVTMISRRREVDNRTPVTDIYQKAYDILSAQKLPKPFQ
ncbi:MAG: DUF3806 domain-containing protein [Halioglobus sp.]